MADTVVVDVKSAWLSKINWTQIVGLAAIVLSVFGIDLDPKTQVMVVSGIASIMGVVTWLLKTFAKPSVTPSSAAKA